VTVGKQATLINPSSWDL